MGQAKRRQAEIEKLKAIDRHKLWAMGATIHECSHVISTLALGGTVKDEGIMLDDNGHGFAATYFTGDADMIWITTLAGPLSEYRFFERLVRFDERTMENVRKGAAADALNLMETMYDRETGRPLVSKALYAKRRLGKAPMSLPPDVYHQSDMLTCAMMLAFSTAGRQTSLKQITVPGLSQSNSLERQAQRRRFWLSTAQPWISWRERWQNHLSTG